jgi:hypothetical protein
MNIISKFKVLQIIFPVSVALAGLGGKLYLDIQETSAEHSSRISKLIEEKSLLSSKLLEAQTTLNTKIQILEKMELANATPFSASSEFSPFILKCVIVGGGLFCVWYVVNNWTTLFAIAKKGLLCLTHDQVLKLSGLDKDGNSVIALKYPNGTMEILFGTGQDPLCLGVLIAKLSDSVANFEALGRAKGKADENCALLVDLRDELSKTIAEQSVEISLKQTEIAKLTLSLEGLSEELVSAQHALKNLDPNVDGDAAQAIADFIATMC